MILWQPVMVTNLQQTVTKIKKFPRAYLDLGINLTPKVHTVMHHAQDFCTLTGRGLGPWSEQASKSIHHDFKQTWQHFKINDTNNELYGEHHLKAVSMYNSHHLLTSHSVHYTNC